MLWLRLALISAIVIAVTGAVVKFTSFLSEKDHLIQDREQKIVSLNTAIAGLNTDLERVKTSNASLEQELKRKDAEAAKARQEAAMLRVTDSESSRRQRDLELKLNERARNDQMDRLSHSRGAERVVQVVNRSAKCEIENFFRTDGQCKSGEWVASTPRPPSDGDGSRAPAGGASNASR